MEKENTRTLVPAHEAAKPQNPSFVDLLNSYIIKAKKIVTVDENSKARDAWEKCTPAKRTKLLEAVRSGAHFKARLDWLIADFPEPQPDFLRGDEDCEIVQVRYNGLYKLCTPETMKLFRLKFVKIWKHATRH